MGEQYITEEETAAEQMKRVSKWRNFTSSTVNSIFPILPKKHSVLAVTEC